MISVNQRGCRTKKKVKYTYPAYSHSVRNDYRQTANGLCYWGVCTAVPDVGPECEKSSEAGAWQERTNRVKAIGRKLGRKTPIW